MKVYVTARVFVPDDKGDCGIHLSMCISVVKGPGFDHILLVGTTKQTVGRRRIPQTTFRAYLTFESFQIINLSAIETSEI